MPFLLWSLVLSEIAKYYGEESNYQQIWARMKGIKGNSAKLRKAVEAGLNPSTVVLEDGYVKKGISVEHKLLPFIFDNFSTSHFPNCFLFPCWY